MDIPKSTVRFFAISASQTWITKKVFRAARGEMELNSFSRTVSATKSTSLTQPSCFGVRVKRGVPSCDDDRFATIARRSRGGSTHW